MSRFVSGPGVIAAGRSDNSNSRKPGGAVLLARSCSRGDRGPAPRFMADGARAVPGERWAHVGELMGTDNDLVPGFSRPRESGN